MSDSIQTILQQIKSGENVALCDILRTGAFDGKQGSEARLAAIIAWVTNSADSDNVDAILTNIYNLQLASAGNEGRIRVEPLGQPSTAIRVSALATSSRVQLSAGIYRVSIKAVGADIRYSLGASAVLTASATTDHYISDGERLDIMVQPSFYIAAIRLGSSNGVLEITQLIN